MKLRGYFHPPGDKSISHRIALLSLLAEGQTLVSGYSSGRDCASSLDAVQNLGVRVDSQSDGLIIRGLGGLVKESASLDCGNSGTTMRLLMGLLAGRPGRFELDGDDSLRRRPMERVAAPLRLMGAQVECPNGRPPVLLTGGPLQGLSYELPIASAQLKSALLLAGVQAEGITQVTEPAPSRDHTERLLTRCGASLKQDGRTWTVKRSELVLPGSFRVPGDASSAAFFLCGAAVVPGSRVEARGVLLNPTRTGWLKVLERMGADVETFVIEEDSEPWGDARVRYSPDLRACEVSAEEIPLLVDEVLILALVATQARGRTVFRQVDELRVKESDRLAAIKAELSKMGGRLDIEGSDLIVEGPTRLSSPREELTAWDDHRIAMTLKIAGIAAGTRVKVRGEECAAISYPDFDRTLESLSQ